MKPFANEAEKFERRELINFLCESAAEQIAAFGHDAVIKTGSFRVSLESRICPT